jgi:hypothetical protein
MRVASWLAQSFLALLLPLASRPESRGKKTVY